MKINVKAILILAAIASFHAGPARAEPKPWIFGWWPDHWDNNFHYYLEDDKRVHNSQWKDSKWQPKDWADQRPGGGPELIKGFYTSRIITGQFQRDDIPVIEVGPGFYHLGGEDKRRVMATIDSVYGITASHDNAMILLYDWFTKKPVGLYNKVGLQIE
jgi:hypothetical protein